MKGWIKCLIILGIGLLITGCSFSFDNTKPNSHEIEIRDYYKNDGLFKNPSNSIALDHNLRFNGVMDEMDIKNRLKEYQHDCLISKNIYTCNLLGKYYQNEGNINLAHKFYMSGCTDRDRYGCGLARYLEAGGY